MNKPQLIKDLFNTLIKELDSCTVEEMEEVKADIYIGELGKVAMKYGNGEYIDLTELHSEGLLQEVNRQFFNRLNMALEVMADKDSEGKVVVSRILGIRKYPEVDEIGLEFGIFNTSDKARFEKFLKKSENVEKIMEKYRKGRINKFGREIEPITFITKG